VGGGWYLKSELFDVILIIIIVIVIVTKKNLQAKKFNKQRHALTRLYPCHVTPESSYFN